MIKLISQVIADFADGEIGQQVSWLFQLKCCTATRRTQPNLHRLAAPGRLCSKCLHMPCT